MNIARRHFLNLTAGAVAMPAVSRLAHADTYPSRAVHLIVPQAAASSTDIHARLVGQFLQDHLGQAFVVDVKPGAGGNVGTEFVVHAAPDGYTLLTVNSQNAISPTLYPDLTFNFLRDIAPIGQISLAPLIMEVNPVGSCQYRSRIHRLRQSQSRQDQHGVGRRRRPAASRRRIVQIDDRPQSGARALSRLDAGDHRYARRPGTTDVRRDADRDAASQGRQIARARRDHEIERIDALPDVPSLSDFLPGYEAEGWLGMGAPTGTPPDIIETLNKQINAALADDKIKQRLTDIGVVVHGGSPADFGKFIACETAKWGKVIKEAGIKPD